MGFAKAFECANITQLTIPISKAAGLVWFLVADLFVLATILFLLNKNGWMIVAGIGAIASQVLIIMAWKDARFGTIANILVAAIIIYTLWKPNPGQ
jgi:hypothetical protein